MKPRCPVCHKIIAISGEEKAESARLSPFCSERCKLIDLGAWLDAEYKIASPQPAEEESQMPPDAGPPCDNQ